MLYMLCYGNGIAVYVCVVLFFHLRRFADLYLAVTVYFRVKSENNYIIESESRCTMLFNLYRLSSSFAHDLWQHGSDIVTIKVGRDVSKFYSTYAS